MVLRKPSQSIHEFIRNALQTSSESVFLEYLIRNCRRCQPTIFFSKVIPMFLHILFDFVFSWEKGSEFPFQEASRGISRCSYYEAFTLIQKSYIMLLMISFGSVRIYEINLDFPTVLSCLYK